jgi:hypothetical protein
LAKAQKQAAQRRERSAEVAKQRAETRQAAKLSTVSSTYQLPNTGAVDLTPYLEKQPGFAQLRQLQGMRQIYRQYGDLKSLNLPPEQLDKLRQLLLEKNQAPQDAREAALQAGIAPNSPAMMKATSDAMQAVDTDIKALVSPDQYAALHNLQTQAGFRSNIEYQIAPDLNAAGLPLTPAQMCALAQVQQDAQQAALQAARGGSKVDIQQQINQAMADQASKILSADQLPIFQQSVSINQQMVEAQAKARAAAQQELGHPVYSWTMRGF